MNQIVTLEGVSKTCAAIPDLVAKAKDDAYRSNQILQLLYSFSNLDADINKISKGVESLEEIAKGMGIPFSGRKYHEYHNSDNLSAYPRY